MNELRGGVILFYFFLFIFFVPKRPLEVAAPTAAVRGRKKMIKSFLPVVLLSASVERFFVCGIFVLYLASGKREPWCFPFLSIYAA